MNSFVHLSGLSPCKSWLLYSGILLLVHAQPVSHDCKKIIHPAVRGRVDFLRRCETCSIDYVACSDKTSCQRQQNIPSELQVPKNNKREIKKNTYTVDRVIAKKKWTSKRMLTIGGSVVIALLIAA